MSHAAEENAREILEHLMFEGFLAETPPLKRLMSALPSVATPPLSDLGSPSALPQRTTRAGWEYQGRSGLQNLGMMPAFEAGPGDGSVTYTRFYRMHLPLYVLAVVSLEPITERPNQGCQIRYYTVTRRLVCRHLLGLPIDSVWRPWETNWSSECIMSILGLCPSCPRRPGLRPHSDVWL